VWRVLPFNPAIFAIAVAVADPYDTNYWYRVESFAGIDTTGATDSTTGLQNAINAVPDGGTLLFPRSCTLLLSSTITVTSRTHIKLIGLQFGTNTDPGALAGDTPKFLWNGTANGIMFYFRSCFSPTIWGFDFESNVAINRYLKFDETAVGGVTGTAGNVQWCTLSNPTANASFRGVSISETSTSNQENYTVANCNINGFGGASLYSKVGGTSNGTKTITASNNPFSAGDVGKRIRISWGGNASTAGGFIDDVIATFTNSGQVSITTNNAPSTQSNVTIHVGQGYGCGIYAGPSQNAKHHKFDLITSLHSQYIIVCAGGSFSAHHILGEGDDYSVVVGHDLDGSNNIGASTGLMTEPVLIDFLESEASLCGIYGGGVAMTISNARIENTKQFGNGFFQLEGDVRITGSGPITVAPTTNQTVVSVVGSSISAQYLGITSVGNNWGNQPSVVGYDFANSYQFGASRWIAVNDRWDDTRASPLMIGGFKQFSSLEPNPSIGSFALISDANVGTWGSAISAGGGGHSVLAWFDSNGKWSVFGQIGV
jgi:hypothetical protein